MGTRLHALLVVPLVIIALASAFGVVAYFLGHALGIPDRLHMAPPVRAGGAVVLGLGLAMLGWVFRYRRAGEVLTSTCVTMQKLVRRTPLQEPSSRTEPLVLEGPQRYVRHPMYFAVVVLWLGWWLLLDYTFLLFMAFFFFGWFNLVIIPFEEKELRALYGEQYGAYAKAVLRFFPSLKCRWRQMLGVMVALVGLACPDQAGALDQDAAVKLCRQYVASQSGAERRQLLGQLADYQGELEPVLGARRASYQPVKTGYLPEEHFTAADLRRCHPDDLLYFVVPAGYRPDQPTGLILFLHGGGPSTSRRAPQATLRFPDANTPPNSNRSGDLFAATGMITVGPSAPWNDQSNARWCLPEADDYLADVLLECKRCFNIDADRVFLVGHSMGGFGAFHQVQRQPDRFAAVVATSGSWSLGYWPAIRGTFLGIVQGVQDAQPGARWHYTDVQYGRWTDQILSREKLDHVYLEHDGEHGIGYGREKIAQFFASAGQIRRDPYYPHVALASLAGFRESHCYPVVHNRWLTLDEAADGEMEYDELVANSTGDFDSWRLEHRIAKHRGAAIEAVNRGDNTIAVTTRNVVRFTVWLHPRMVDLSRPVTIVVDDKVRFEGRVKPSLATAMESYRRRQDWGLIYPIKIELTNP